jgi:hypothetical protein
MTARLAPASGPARTLTSVALLSACVPCGATSSAPLAAELPNVAPPQAALEDRGVDRVEGPRVWGEVVQGCRLSVSPSPFSVTAGHAIDLTITFRNDGPDDVDFPRVGTPEQDYAYTVLREGKAVPLTLRGRELLADDRPLSVTSLRVAAHDERVTTLHLNVLFDVSETGAYTIEVRKVLRARRDAGASVETLSAQTTVRVTEVPRPRRQAVEDRDRRKVQGP